MVVLAAVAGIEVEEAGKIGAELVAVGLAEDMGVGHWRLDPELAPYLAGQMAKAETEETRAKWAEAMAALAAILCNEKIADARLAHDLARLELPNLTAMLEWGEDRWAAERAVGLASCVESVLSKLGRPQFLVRATGVRERASKSLGAWGHAGYVAQDANVKRLLEGSNWSAAKTAAKDLLERCRVAGETAYPNAAYDLATAHFLFGETLKLGGCADAALLLLIDARDRFQGLADDGDANADGMVADVTTAIGCCYCDLGRLDAAAESHETAIQHHQARGRVRRAAVAKCELGLVRLRQTRFDEALSALTEARDTFEALGEPRSVATAWHQIGCVHDQAGRWEFAETAYRLSLAIQVRENDLRGQALSLAHLGILMSKTERRREEAVAFCRQAIDLWVALKDRASEGRTRSNLAIALLALDRCDEARGQVGTAIDCATGLGDAAEPWKIWHILELVERKTGHVEAAAAARSQAITAYAAYLHNGGESTSPHAQFLSRVAQALRDQALGEIVRDVLTTLASGPDLAPSLRTLFSKLQSILDGSRDPTLAADPDLRYDDAVELQLLLESL